MRAALLAFALLPSIAFAAITINTPSPTQYWVQGASNLIAWVYNPGDPPTVDIVVTNSDNQTLNGPFSIARGVPVSQETITVTNVTLRVATGYTVSFVDPTNETQVLAQSSTFEVKAAGTSPAPTTAPSSTSVQASGSETPSGSATSSGASATPTTKRNSALGLVADASRLFYSSAIVAIGSFFL